ncbi:MAG: S-layer homology domain-containing protein [Oscillospiraceae bacterium]|jgi:hypothetical protein|nr:S-layer homology domain-containing protein [Oscillospiraceae bacterium]
MDELRDPPYQSNTPGTDEHPRAGLPSYGAITANWKDGVLVADGSAIIGEPAALEVAWWPTGVIKTASGFGQNEAMGYKTTPTITVKLYAGEGTSGEPLFDRTLWLFAPSLIALTTVTVRPQGNQLRIYFIMPDAEKLTLSVQLDDQEPVVKTYATGLDSAIADLRSEYDKLENLPWRYFVDRTIDSAAAQLVTNPGNRDAILAAARTELERFVNGNAVLGTDYIEVAFAGVLVRVAPGIQQSRAFMAALEQAYPHEKGFWYFDAVGSTFGLWVNGFGGRLYTQSELDSGYLESAIVAPSKTFAVGDPLPRSGQISGGQSGGLQYYVNGFYADIGVSGWLVSHGEMFTWGPTVAGYGAPPRAEDINDPKNLRYNWAKNVLNDYGVLKAELDVFPGITTLPIDTLIANLKTAYPAVADRLDWNLPAEFTENPAIEAMRVQFAALTSESTPQEIAAANSAFNNLPRLRDSNISKHYFKFFEPYKSAYDNFVSVKARVGSGGGLVDVVPYTTALSGALAYLQENVQNPAVASVGGEWAVLALARAGVTNDALYNNYLANLAAATVSGATDSERVTLALTSLGIDASGYGDTDYTAAFKNYASVSGSTVNFKIFGLLALNAGAYSGEVSAYINGILDAQVTGGGWNLNGSGNADADTTAMALQALAPYYNANALNDTSGDNLEFRILGAVQQSLERLKVLQQASGGFAGFGGLPENSTESAAQVVVALTALCIDPTGAEWTKTNGGNPLTALLANYNEAGYFGQGGNANFDEMSTEQAAYALVAYNRFVNNAAPLYTMIDAINPPEPPAQDVNKTALVAAIATANALSSADYTTNSWNNLQIALTSAIAYNTGTAATQSQVDGAVTAIETAIANLVPKSTGGGTTTAKKYVALTVRDPQGATYFSGQIELESDDNAYSVLLKAGLTVRTANGGQYGGLYIESINGLAEFDKGSGSGWMYSVNGVFPEYSASLYALTGGETVNWLYTRDLGEDLKNYGSGSVQPGGGGSGTSDTTDISDEATPLANAPENSVSVEIKATIKDGAATATIAEEALKDLIGEAKEDNKTNITLEITGGNGASSVELDLIASSVNDLAKSNLSLTVESELASVTLDSATLNELVKGVSDTETIRIDVSVADNKTALTEEQQELVGDNPVIEADVYIGSTKVHDFGGTVTVFVPYTPPATVKAEDYDLLTVYYLDDNGVLTGIKGAKYDPKTGLLTFKTNHFSTFVLREWINPFSDVAKEAWYYKSVRYGYSNELVKGIGDGKFAPNLNLTRAQLVTILARQSGVDTTGGATWYEQALTWGKSSGITDGTNPESNITREQVAAMVYRYAGSPAATGSLSKFSDADKVSDWAEDAMKWAVETGLFIGDGGKLNPLGNATRAEIVTILERYLGNTK